MIGKITLVGAGPGDCGLITLKAVVAIEKADTVFYDRLVSPQVMAMVKPGTKCINVGKNAGNHMVPQDEINNMILNAAKSGENVVRLKGGDPYLFGRGAEELEDIIAENIAFEVIPGITSAIAVPEMAGIPVTHRDYSSAVHIITAHRKANEPLRLDYKSLVKLNGTLVFLMGVGKIDDLAKNLIKAGMPASMPAALIMNGTTHKQRKVVCDLNNIAQQAKEEGLSSPSVFVVGEVCKLSHKLDRTGMLPLYKTSVMITRPQNRNSKLAEKLKNLGCCVTEIPMIEIKPISIKPEIIDKLNDYNWIVFTSRTGVETFIDQLVEHNKDVRELGNCKIAAVGNETQKALHKKGLLVDYMPKIFDAEHLLDGLKSVIKTDDKILLYRSALGRGLLPEELAKITTCVDDIAAYETNLTNTYSEYFAKQTAENEFDYIMFTSGSTIEGFVALVGNKNLSQIKAVCIGAQTAEKAKDYGMQVYQSDNVTIDSMVEKLLELTGVENNDK